MGWSSEAVGLEGVGVVENGLSVRADGVVVAVVDAGWGVVADAGVAVVVVVVVEEGVGEVAVRGTRLVVQSLCGLGLVGRGPL